MIVQGIVARVVMTIRVDDPLSRDVATLIEAHLEFARSETPLCHVFALPAEKLIDDDIVLYSCRDEDRLLGIGALRRIDDGHFEVKSMHTDRSVRHQGVGRLILEHLISEARRHGARRISLETGTSSGFEAARSLYRKAGFDVCGPFGDYSASPDNVCMTLAL
jgi:putative acetyltransferase